jgi:hypothetical protein
MSRQQRTRGPSPRGREGSGPPPIPATPASRRLPATRIPRGRRIQAPRREPAGRRAVGREMPPEARATVHHQPAPNAITTERPMVATQATWRDGGPLGGVHLAEARGGSVPSRRTLAAGIQPFARSWETSLRHPGCGRFPNAGSSGTGPPLANPYSARGRNRSPPARAGGTAGRWARDVPGSPSNRPPPTRPKRCHNRATDGGCRTPPARAALLVTP